VEDIFVASVDPFEEYEDLWAALCTVPARHLRQKATEYAFMVEDQPWWRRFLLRLQRVDVPDLGSVSPIAAAEWYDGVLKRTVKTSLQIGDLMAFGFQSPRTADAVRQPIPADMWEGEIDFEGSSVRKGTLAFEGIKAIPKNELTAQVTPETPQSHAPVTSKPVGRPSMREAIRSAFASAHEAGKLALEKSFLANTAAIRAEFQSMSADLVNDETKPDNETIRRHAGGLFKKLKASSKL
jgi:hypothetical protein